MRILLLCLAICTAQSAFAQGFITNPLIFERETITITPVATPEQNTVPPTTDEKPEATPVIAARSAQTFNVEVRPEDALKLEYIQALTALNESNGVMIAFGAPTIAPLPFFRVQQATDVLFIDDAGIILQIYPGHIPMDISRDIYADKPIKALLYLKAGVVTARDIRPKDVVQGRVFNPPPPLLQ